MLYLTESDVRELIDMPAAIAVVEDAFRRLADGRAVNVPRQRAVGAGIVVHTMSAAADYLGFAGWKCYATTKRGARFLVGLYDVATSEPAALIEADLLGQLRTGATTGVAARRLAADDADRLGLFGSGLQARTQLAAVAAVRPIRSVAIFSRDPERRRRFASAASAELGIDCFAVDRPDEAVRNLPLVITATTSRTPVFDGRDVAPGALVCAVGSNWLNKAEIDATTVGRAARVVCDDVAACRHEAGDLAAAADVGAFDWSQAVALADVVAGKTPGRRAADDLLVFKSVGLAVEDVALGVEVLRRAQTRGLGREIANPA